MRETIATIVANIAPLDDLERDQIAQTLVWIASGAPLCRIEKPATPPKHLVSYFVLVDATHKKLLLVDHRKADLWLPSGGHVEPDEHPESTVVRELWEELHMAASWLLPEPLLLTVTETVGSTAGHVDVSLWYVLEGDSTESLDFDAEEFRAVAWFPFDDLPTSRTDPHLQRFAAKLRAALASM